MTTYEAGDVIGDCQSPMCAGKVIYQGGSEAICSSCNVTYTVSFDEGESEQNSSDQKDVPDAPAPTPPPPVEPERRPVSQEPGSSEIIYPTVADPESITEIMTPPVEQPKKVFISDSVSREPVSPIIEGGVTGEIVGKLTDPVMGNPEILKRDLELDPKCVDANPSGGVELPDYIKKSRAWKWAHMMKKTGNPYREGTKSWKVFQIFDEDPRTVEDAVVICPSIGLADKLSYLLTVYEVISHCVAAGLLVINEETRIISVCKGKPQPAEMP